MPRFADILGQDHAVQALQRAIHNHRLAGAYLFSGPAGVGKASTAVTLAAAVNCATRPGEGCDHCAPCTKMAAGQHPDLIVVVPDGTLIKIDQVRELHQHLVYPPHEGRRRVVVIDGADVLNLNAANALLKAVEEPRPDTTFVLASSAAHQVIPTLRSRCQRIRFRPLRREQVGEVVARHSERTTEDQQIAVAVAEGSPGRALRLLQSEQLDSARAIMDGILAAARAGDAATLFETSEAAGRDRAPMIDACELLRAWLRDLLLCHEGLAAERLIHAHQRETLIAETARLDRRSILRRLRAVQQAQAALLGNANPRLTLETLVLQMRPSLV